MHPGITKKVKPCHADVEQMQHWKTSWNAYLIEFIAI
jgi:hypothetical protein